MWFDIDVIVGIGLNVVILDDVLNVLILMWCSMSYIMMMLTFVDIDKLINVGLTVFILYDVLNVVDLDGVNFC